MASQAAIIIACHRPSEVPADPLYLPLQVGAAGRESIGFARDDQGDNISTKNPLYCELTGLYWGWKHLSGKALGLVQYRRYFTCRSRLYRRQHSLSQNVLSQDEAAQLLSRYRVLLPKKRHYWIETIYSQYDHTFDGSQLDQAAAVIQQRCPEYTLDFQTFMKQRSGYMFNMFLMSRPLADQYCTWLFDLLPGIEARVDTAGMTDFQRRYIGRISERLLNVWLLHQLRTGRLNQSEIHEIPYFYLGRINWLAKAGSFLAAKLFHRKYRRSF